MSNRKGYLFYAPNGIEYQLVADFVGQHIEGTKEYEKYQCSDVLGDRLVAMVYKKQHLFVTPDELKGFIDFDVVALATVINDCARDISREN